MYHTTKTGEKIHLRDLSDSHLDNILKVFEHKAKEGLLVQMGENGVDVENTWYCEDTYYGEEALRLLNYDAYRGEQLIRLTNKKQKVIISADFDGTCVIPLYFHTNYFTKGDKIVIGDSVKGEVIADPETLDKRYKTLVKVPIKEVHLISSKTHNVIMDPDSFVFMKSSINYKS